MPIIGIDYIENRNKSEEGGFLDDANAYGNFVASEVAGERGKAFGYRWRPHDVAAVMTIRVELRQISKRFGGVQALSKVDFTIEPGEIHALVGENGAGKSTLGRIIGGSTTPDSGSVAINGAPISLATPRIALSQGIARIDQEIQLVPTLSVCENVLLGAEPRLGGFIARSRLRDEFHELNEASGFQLDPDIKAGLLSVAQQQKVEILRSLSRRAKLIVLDEPTAALSIDEKDKLHDLLRQLNATGTTIVYISHFLDEVLRLASRVSILRNGELIRTANSKDETTATLINGMIGRDLGTLFPPIPPIAKPERIIFRARKVASQAMGGGVSLEVRAGEIKGIFGLVGSGRSEFARSVFGADRVAHGELFLDGKAFRPRGCRSSIDKGVAFIPEDRKKLGLCLERPLAENVSLPFLRDFSKFGLVQRNKERAVAAKLFSRFSVRCDNIDAPASTLSGGNQQKVLFSKWLMRTPRLLIIDEPTRGVDVGARHSIYEIVCALAQAGVAIIVISSDLEEVLGLSHDLLVMRNGRIVRNFDPQTASRDDILQAAFGLMSGNGGEATAA